MDGYIKNKTQAIKSVRKAILGKYAVTIFILFMLFAFLFAAFVTLPHPDKWKEETVVFSELRRERLGFNRSDSDVLVTTDGRMFSIPFLTEELKNALVAGESYTITYSTRVFGRSIKGFVIEGSIYIDINNSIASWQEECKGVAITACAMFAAEILALILIDRLWCKKEYDQLKKLKENITQREQRISKS